MSARISASAHSQRNPKTAVLKKLLLACAIGMALWAGLLFLSSILCLKFDASGWVIPLCAYLCCVLASFPAGFLSAKSVGKSGLLCGTLVGLSICILLVILCMVFYGSVGKGFWIGSAITIISAALGGITALNLRRRRKYR